MALSSCSGFTRCYNLGHAQSTRARLAHGRGVTDMTIRASAGTSCSYRECMPSSIAVECRRVLGVGPNASRCEVKAAYGKLALQQHPDVCRDDECRVVNFTEVNYAYEFLMALTPSLQDKSQKWDASDSASSAQCEGDDDPWADFLQNLVSSYCREDFSSYYSNLKLYSEAGRSRLRCYRAGSFPYYQRN